MKQICKVAQKNSLKPTCVYQNRYQRLNFHRFLPVYSSFVSCQSSRGIQNSFVFIGAVDANGEHGTPQKGSGNQTPQLSSSGTLTPQMVESVAMNDTPWVVKLCVKNVAPHLLKQEGPLGEGAAGDMLPSQQVQDGAAHIPARTVVENAQPLPVRLESLQLLAHLAKGYFPLIR